MDFELTPELKDLEARARRFVDEELIPHELEVDEKEKLPERTRQRIRRRAIADGLWPMNVPKELGGLGASVLAQVIAQEQAGRATNHLWGYVGGPYNALMRCNEAQREKYLKPALEGTWTVAYAVTEPGAGSDTTNLKTTAVKKGDRWVINGEKWFVSGGEKGLAVLVHTVTGPGEETLFLVDHGTPGMRIKRMPRFMNRSEDEHPEIVFEDCEVPEEQILGGRGEADAISKAWFREERLHIAARCLGAAQRLLEEMKRWCGERETFGRKLFEHQGIGWMLADSATELYAARLVTYKTAWEEDAGVCDVKELHTKASIAKLYASEMANRVADRAVQVFGGRGYCADYAVERLFRDVRVDRIWEGSSEMMRGIVLNGVMKRDLDRLLR
ncbi:MAG: acyl-CoA dehydrogenase family protein [Planctomycetota bacterium]|jgi:alkylation response protein AidB-like acyl-CoA dehydrogenase